MNRPAYPMVRVDLELLIAPTDEGRVAEKIRSSVSQSAAESAYRLGEPVWEDNVAAQDLLQQWRIEHPGAAMEDRRIRRFTMDVGGDGVADLVDDIGWAAIDAICPNAREDDRRLEAGETVPAVADEYPWSSATRLITGAAED